MFHSALVFTFVFQLVTRLNGDRIVSTHAIVLCTWRVIPLMENVNVLLDGREMRVKTVRPITGSWKRSNLIDCVELVCLACELGYYGWRCESVCNCVNGECDHVNGSCDCSIGYTGKMCEGKV